MQYDLIFLIVTLVIIFFSMKKGFFMEIFQIFSLFIAFWISKNYSFMTANYLLSFLKSDSWRMGLSYVFTFVVIFIISLLFFSYINDKISARKSVKTIDKTMGFLFGLCKSAVIISIFLVLLVKFDIIDRHAIVSSSKVGKFLFILIDKLNVF